MTLEWGATVQQRQALRGQLKIELRNSQSSIFGAASFIFKRPSRVLLTNVTRAGSVHKRTNIKLFAASPKDPMYELVGRVPQHLNIL